MKRRTKTLAALVLLAALTATAGSRLVRKHFQHAAHQQATAFIKELGGETSAYWDPPAVYPVWLLDSSIQDYLPGGSMQGVVILQGPAIDDNVLPELRKLCTVECLALQKTSLTDASSIRLQHPLHLRRLDLTRSHVSHEGIRQIVREFPNLRFLTLHGTEVNDADIVELQRLKNLTLLTISQTHITDAAVLELPRFPALQYLYLDVTQFSRESLRLLPAVDGLEILGLYGADIPDEDLAFLARMKALKTLVLEENHVDATRLAQIARNWPNLEVKLWNPDAPR